ncbi:MAG: response regulator [Candidatus Riflemargulisbacteria bacterium]
MTKTLLIIDDESSIRWIIKVAFEEEDIRIIEASSGEEGVATALQILPDLIIMDYKLPGINGWEATKTIKKTLPNTIIVGHTGYANADNKKQGFESGCTEILNKPVDLDEWEEVISKYLSK